MRNERIAMRAARAVYASIVALAAIVVTNEAGYDPAEVISAVIGAVIATSLAEQYAEYIGHVIRERRHLTRAETAEQIRDGIAGTLAAMASVLPFLAVELGLISQRVAYDIAAWLGLGVIGGYSLLANREAGLSGARNIVVTGLALAVGASLIVIKTLTH